MHTFSDCGHSPQSCIGLTALAEGTVVSIAVLAGRDQDIEHHLPQTVGAVAAAARGHLRVPVRRSGTITKAKLPQFLDDQLAGFPMVSRPTVAQ